MGILSRNTILKMDALPVAINPDLAEAPPQKRSWTQDGLTVGKVTRMGGTEFEGVTAKDTLLLVSTPWSVIGGYDGQKNQKVTFLKNDFTYSLQGTHSNSVATASGQGLFLSFDKKFRLDMEATLPSASKLDEPLTATSGLPNAAAYQQLLQTFLDTGGQGGRLRLENLLTLVLGDVYMRMQKVTHTDQSYILPAPVLSKIDEYIDANCDQKIGVQELADLANFSMFHFSKVFKETTGLPPHQYVIQHRLDRVRHLLETSKLSLAQIAYEAGFSSQSHMSVTFQQNFGASPGKYRKTIKS